MFYKILLRITHRMEHVSQHVFEEVIASAETADGAAEQAIAAYRADHPDKVMNIAALKLEPIPAPAPVEPEPAPEEAPAPAPVNNKYPATGNPSEAK